MKRKAAVAGSFYPDDPKQLKQEIEELIERVVWDQAFSGIRAIIVPHAGYVYSGSVAAAAYRQVADHPYQTVFLIGASHHCNFRGVATVGVDEFETPLGGMKVNQTVIEQLMSESSLFFRDDGIHSDEHSLEVQLPFIRELLNVKDGIVPLLVGSDSRQELQEMADGLKPCLNASNLFVISTDFSHYPPGDFAEEEDRLTADVICSNNYDALVSHLNAQKQHEVPNLLTGLCGWRAVLLLLALTEEKNLRFQKLLYEHSGMKLLRDTSRVVGYQAIAVVEDKQTPVTRQMKEYLLQIAHRAIGRHLGVMSEEAIAAPSQLMPSSGVFVSVYCNEELRGCIGQFESVQPLEKLIEEEAVNAAFYDSRFKSIEAAELPRLKIEISILTPLEVVKDIGEIEVGRHGIYIKKGMQHGTFLPQVGARNNWSVEEYLGYCARNKAKIGWDGWREAQIYKYEALIISDKDD